MKKYLIVGAGNFGASSALELATRDPSASIILIDDGPFPNPRAASHDINKIVRPDYADPLYMIIMIVAMKLWREDKLYSPYYHETGMIRADNTGFNDGCMENFKALGHEVLGGYISVEDMRTKWGGLFRNAILDGVDQCYHNPLAGWADAAKALEAVIRAAINKGVTYLDAVVQKLVFDESKTCQGVELANGDILRADQIVLCTGARTALLLADSAPTDRSIQAGNKLIATGAVSYALKLNKSQWPKYQSAPVIKNGLSHTHGEIIPLNGDGILKCNYEMSFTNMIYHKASGQFISTPPGIRSEKTWTQSAVPESLKMSARKVITNVYGTEIEGIESESWRVCWDISTPSHNFIISPHPQCRNLAIAAGGSFHGWKFLPVIGKYVIDMLEGNLQEDLAKRWSWDEAEGLANSDQKANHTYSIKADLKDIEGWNEIAAAYAGGEFAE